VNGLNPEGSFIFTSKKMMRQVLFFFLILFCSQLQTMAQQTEAIPANPIPDTYTVSVENMSTYIRQNFGSDTARIRAIYDWVTTHISYDVARFLARNNGPATQPPAAAEVLQARTAVCQGYAELFVALCKGAGIEAMSIGGYSKQQGKVSEVGHAWVAALLDNEWYLFDPTWGAGIVRNERFVKRYTNRFYKVPPAKFIEDHMPCDPMLQLLNHPLSPDEFSEGKPAGTRILFNYNDSIRIFRQLSPLAQAGAELRRMELAGVSNKLLQERETYLKNTINAAASKDAFTEAQAAYQYSYDLYKTFMASKRNQFAGLKDTEVRSSIDSIEFYIKKSRSVLQEANPKTDAQRSSKTRFTTALDQFWTEVVKQKDFVSRWLATDKEKRKQLFMR
jgi:hypothetical protein